MYVPDRRAIEAYEKKMLEEIESRKEAERRDGQRKAEQHQGFIGDGDSYLRYLMIEYDLTQDEADAIAVYAFMERDYLPEPLKSWYKTIGDHYNYRDSVEADALRRIVWEKGLIQYFYPPRRFFSFSAPKRGMIGSIPPPPAADDEGGEHNYIRPPSVFAQWMDAMEQRTFMDYATRQRARGERRTVVYDPFGDLDEEP
jgi:hypothetical protein